MKNYLITLSALFIILILSTSCEDVIGLEKKIWKKKIDTVKKDTVVKDDTLKFDSNNVSKLKFEPKEADFGRVPLGDFKELYFCIKNTSDDKFLIENVECDNPAFTVYAANLPVSIPPGGEFCMVINFIPENQGEQIGLIIINNNPEYFLIVRGYGT